VPDPFAVAVAIGLLGAVVAGPVAAYGLDLLPQRWRRTTEWLLIVGAVGLAGLLANAPGPTVLVYAYVYVLATLPGLVAFLAFLTLLASALVSLAPLYFVIGDLTRSWPAYVPAVSLDRAFSLQPAWMFVYGSLYVFVVVMPLLVVREQELFRRAMQAYLTVMIVSYVGFLLFPTAAPRPAEVIGDGFSAWSLRLAYSIDPPHGCFPSLHVAYSCVAALTCYRVHRGVGVIAGLWAALIGVSTLYTKQHYVVDVIAGALAACVAYVLFLRSHPREAIAERDRRGAPLRAMAAVGIFAVMVAGFWIAYQMGMVVLVSVVPFVPFIFFVFSGRSSAHVPASRS
jgi:membrane-associated phospholipid phosphatase